MPEGHAAQGNISEVKLELQGEHSNNVITIYTRNTQTAKLTTCWIQGNGRLTVKATTKNQIGWSDNSSEVEYFHDKCK